ncbi:unnamed protein product [Bursaphelenchus xylophilus]|uniref:(pine wood nematode) hypothetical protein n=1 Tax=Bursaphelenchus xylophilus TaxID=6326 RepID=A0A7I8X123_BURXY|nr:unnamed protein product [Bursaphelenchus xylophilus]CAG9129800.1 unnamed protein product [Bursaphelenchus xylophilus]
MVKNGIFLANVSLSNCNNINSTVQLVATVTDSNQESETLAIEYSPKGPELEIIPSRPFVTKDTKEIYLYIRYLSKLSTNERLYVEEHCVSKNRNYNGRVSHPHAQEHQGFYAVKLEVNENCLVNIIKAAVKTNGEAKKGPEEMLALPFIHDSDKIHFNWISVRKPLKFIYREGDVFEAKVEHLNDLNYAVVCDGQLKRYEQITTGRLSIEVTGSLNGICTFYVYSASASDNKFDMWTFMADTEKCPNSKFGIALSKNHIQVGENIDVTLTGTPHSLALLRVIDSRLETFLTHHLHNKRNKLFFFPEFSKPDLSNQNSFISGLVDSKELFGNTVKVCKDAASVLIDCNLNFCTGKSGISDTCLGMLKSECGGKINNMVMGPLTDGTPATTSVTRLHNVLMSSAFDFVGNKAEETKQVPVQDDPISNTPVPTQDKTTKDFIREFFPEVWLFEDYVIPESGKHSLTLQGQHSVTKFVLQSGFWTNGRQNMCKTGIHNIQIERKIYMNVDIPLHVYENETIQARITVSGDHTESKQLSICFDFFSPLVCGDVGSNGMLGEVEYSQITLEPGQSVIKTIFVKFLKTGDHKLTFKLVDNPTFSVGRWHCRDDGLYVHDRIQLNVRVGNRVDLDEHFRKMVLQRPISRPTMLLMDAGGPQMVDVIEFEKDFMENGTMLADVKVQSNENIYNSEMELSEWEYSLVESKPKKNRLRLLSRQRRDLTVSYGLGSVIKGLSQLTYQKIRQNKEDEEYNTAIGSLLSELLTYSDCHSGHQNPACGFGEYGAPSTPFQRDPLLSLLATSLLCEQNAAEQYVCGPMEYFKELAKTLPLHRQPSYVDGMSFKEEKDRKDFLLALISWVGRDCKKYECVSNSTAWKDIYTIRFDEAGQNYRDMRVDAALARVVTTSTAIIKKDRLMQKADLNQVPFWRVNLKNEENGPADIMEDSVQKNADVLANSLGMLAFTTKDDDYNYWKNLIDFDKLSKWLVEQQDSNGQYGSPVGTYFGLRALYVYGKHQIGHRLTRHLMGNISVEGESAGRTFNETDLPLALSLPTSAKKVHVSSFGDSPLVLGVRVLTEKRKRSKRDPNDIYPVEIKLRQRRNPNNSFTQVVTITPHSALLKTIQIEHGLFTGFTSKKEYFSTDVTVIRPIEFSHTAAHFVLGGLQKDSPATYELTINEPSNGYIPENLAPIAVVARMNGIVGVLVIGAEELDFFGNFRRKREVRTLLESKSESSVVETVCLDNGACTCAEVTCETECTNCKSTSVDQLCSEFKERGFAVIFRIVSTRTEQRLGANYDVYDVKILEWYGGDKEPETFSIWLRECNTQCHLMTRQNTDKARYLLIGNPEGIFYGSQSANSSPDLLRKHYLVRDGDRLARSMDCYSTFSQFQDADCVRA